MTALVYLGHGQSDCGGGFSNQNLSGYHLLHAATRKGWRGQARFRESLGIAFVLYITNKQKGEKASARWENGVRGLMRKKTDTLYKHVLEQEFD